jgi:UDP-4-amino-4,6-dideoxy-N-acetyl-beta-L-altrosamine transaminase
MTSALRSAQAEPDALLPYGRHALDEADIAAVVEALRSGWLAHGPGVGRFEQAFAAAVGAGQAVGCSSGTAALHLALASLDVGEGDLCIVPAMTFLATATAARFCGAEVAFADVDPDTGLITEETLAQALEATGRRVAAVLPVHLGGRLCDMRAISGLARAAGAVVVEDACHALGGRDAEDDPVGGCAWSDAACFSLHPVKTLAAGEAGMVSLNDPERAERLRRLRNHGVAKDPGLITDPDLSCDGQGALNPWSYEQVELGFNYRMNEMEAALGLSQLGKLQAFAARRRALTDAYDAALRPLAPLVRPVARGAGRLAPHLYQVLIDFPASGRSRAEVMRGLAGRRIGSQVHYIPLYRQPYFRARYGEMRLEGAEAFYDRVLALPLFPAMADGDVARVVDALAATLGS